MRRSNPYDHLLDVKGVSLEVLGVNGIALERRDALSAVEFLRKDRIPILGGDVYLDCDGRIGPAYVNWYTSPQPGEAFEGYARRSWDTTTKHVDGFPEPESGRPLFALMVADTASITT